jgi:tyrosine-protein phosphatase
VDGPVQILPGIWLGSEDNARDWKALVSRGIGSILNVAKEVTTPFDALLSSQPLRSVALAPDQAEQCREGDATFYPAHGPSGRPAMHYLKLPWSHGQPDLVNVGFLKAMEYIDAAVGRGDGVLIQYVSRRAFPHLH